MRSIAVDDEIAADPARGHLADCFGGLAPDLLEQWDRQGDPIKFTSDEGEFRRRHVADDSEVDAVEIRPALLPVIRIARQRDPFVGLEFNEFERASADRMLTHLVQCYVAWINYRKAGGEQRDKRRLRSLQMEGNLIIAIGGHLLQIAVPGLARVEAKLFARLFGQQVPGAFDVLGGERLAVGCAPAM
jgi:hypothetical protein